MPKEPQKKRRVSQFFSFFLLKKIKGAKIHFGICYVLGMYSLYYVAVSKNRRLLKMLIAE